MIKSSTVSNMTMITGLYFVNIHGFERAARVFTSENCAVISYASMAYREITGRLPESGRRFEFLGVSSDKKELFFSTWTN